MPSGVEDLERSIKRLGYLLLAYIVQYLIPGLPFHNMIIKYFTEKYYGRLRHSIASIHSHRRLGRKSVRVYALRSLAGIGVGVLAVKVKPEIKVDNITIRLFESVEPRILEDQLLFLRDHCYFDTYTMGLGTLQSLDGQRLVSILHYVPLPSPVWPRFHQAWSIIEDVLSSGRYWYVRVDGGRVKRGVAELSIYLDEVRVYDVTRPIRFSGAILKASRRCIEERWDLAIEVLEGSDVVDPLFKALFEDNWSTLLKAAEEIYLLKRGEYLRLFEPRTGFENFISKEWWDVREALKWRVADKCVVCGNATGYPLQPHVYSQYVAVYTAHSVDPFLNMNILHREAWVQGAFKRLRTLMDMADVKSWEEVVDVLEFRFKDLLWKGLFDLVASGVVLGAHVGLSLKCGKRFQSFIVELNGVSYRHVDVLAKALSHTNTTMLLLYSTSSRSALFNAFVYDVDGFMEFVRRIARLGIASDARVYRVLYNVNFPFPFEMWVPGYGWVLSNEPLVLLATHLMSLDIWCRRYLSCARAAWRGNSAAKRLLHVMREQVPAMIQKALDEITSGG